MENKKIKISSIVENQLPDFVKEDYPLVSELFTEYYKSLETLGSSLNIIENIDSYIRVNNLTNLVESTSLSADVSIFDSTLYVESTDGFPKSYGLVLINNEIILYKYKTNNSFNECVRGFSGVVDYNSGDLEDLEFLDSNIHDHNIGDVVKNLGILFLKEFFIKLKKQFAFGFEDTDLYSNLNKNIFLKQSKDFYSSKGSAQSFEILFRVLYGKDVEVILPRDYLIKPSDAQYRVTKNIVIEVIDGNPEELVNKTIFQDQYNNISKAFATVVDVQKIVRNNKQYYILMLDYDFDKDIIVSGTIFGDIPIHPKTKIAENVSKNSKEISVDSTIGFENSGELTLNNGLIDLYITYEGKTINQFLNCEGVIDDIEAGTTISINTFAYGFSDDLQNKITFRISGILSELDISERNFYHTNKSFGKVITLGYNSTDVKDNDWIFNNTVKCNVSNFTNIGNNSYSIETYDDSGIKTNDSIEIDIIKLVSGNLSRETIIIPGNQVIVPFGSIPGKKFQINNIDYEILDIFTVKRVLTKYKEKYLSDVLNTYKDDDNNIYIASSSLPSYGTNYNVEDYSVTLDTNFNNENILKISNLNDHGFITGDAVEYIPEKVPNSLNLTRGVYYVERENSKEIKLYKSKNNIDRQKQNPSEQNYITIDQVGIGTTIGVLSSILPNTISGINTLGVGISIGNYVFNSNLFINNNVKITSIGINSITISESHNLTSGSIDDSFSFREPTKDIIRLLKLSKENSEVDSQRLVKVIETPVNDGKIYETTPGTIGIFANGVELLNYKSNDYVYYGSIETIEVINSGSNYDVINPPLLKISKPDNGIECKAHCHVEGELHRIDIIDSGANYIDIPTININGGGGSGATAIPNLIDYKYSIDIDSSSSNGKINLQQNQVGFSTYHKFIDGESVIYKTHKNTAIGGLSTDSKYYVSVVDEYRINLHKNLSDALSKTNIINLSNYGKGSHEFESLNNKRKLNSITITNSGSGYKNKKILVPSSGINTASNTINVSNHPFESGEVIYYFGGDQNISGLGTGIYMVTKIDNTSFKLSNVGIGSTNKDFYYNTEQYINFKDSGQGTHIFNYEPIVVEVSGTIGISSYVNNIFRTEVQPIFRGKITSIFVSDVGSGYGSFDIINYNKQPDFSLHYGSGAKAIPLISDGKILDIIVTKPGYEYNSPPDIIVRGKGIGASLTPIIEDGKLIDIKVINSGVYYDEKDTIIDIVSPGTGYQLLSYPKIWTINKLYRLIQNNKIPIDGSVIYRGKNEDYGLQYTHLYAPRQLRELLFSETIEDGEVKYRNDYENDKDDNIKKYHSPIIGWAYDGNPIYGPYGYVSPENKGVKLINSGYEITNTNISNRPSIDSFPLGYFVEDYEFTYSGDLDEHNGRYCVTPDYPNGTYAYFMTIDPDGVGVNKSPKFPYVIGNTYKSKPIDSNLNVALNQENFTSNINNLIRNTTPYNTLSDNSNYEYFLLKDDVFDQKVEVKSTRRGKIDSIKIISGGKNYKVGDPLEFDNENSKGSGVSAKVEFVDGEEVKEISQSKYTLNDVEFYRIADEYIGISSSPHNILNNDTVFIDSLTNTNKSISGIFNVNVRYNNLILTNAVGDVSSTGIVTYFNVSGSLDLPKIKENDIFTINNEDIKVLNIDKNSSRIRVLREQNSTTSSEHPIYSTLEEKSRKIYIKPNNIKDNTSYNLNREIYFNPVESLGLGEIIGAGHTLYFSNPGSGITSIIIPEKTIYIKNHNLNTNDRLFYKSNSESPITVSNGNFQFQLADETELIVKKITNDLIGISTVGINTELFFINPGIGEYHRFHTNYNTTLKGNVSKTIITIHTNTNHNLSKGDDVYLSVYPGITTTISILYNECNRRLLVNPRDFVEVDLINNLIVVENHNYKTGDKLLFTSTISNNNLYNENIYYAVVYDKDRIKLSNNYYEAVKLYPKVINFTTNFTGTLSQINPSIELIRNNKVIFDLSHDSLSEISVDGSLVESFDFLLFLDNQFSSLYFPISSNGKLKIEKYGTIGVDGYVTFTIDEKFPNQIYYNLIPKSKKVIKNEIYTDNEVWGYNKISFVNSKLSGKWNIKNITLNAFEIQVPIVEKFNSYKNGIFKYHTNSQTALGSIYSIKILSKGDNYLSLPSVKNIISDSGFDAIVIPQSNLIGNINFTKISNNNYNYPLDFTLKPLIKFPSIVRVERLSYIESIKVISPGLYYNIPPDIVIIDGFSNEVVDDIILEYDIREKYVSIIKNTKGIYNNQPRVVAINNSNGIGIKSLSYDNSTKLVTAYLSKQFSDIGDFPIQIGENIFVEGISIENQSGRGYNSKNYNYKLFTVTNVFENLGGSGAAIEYSLSDLLSSSEIPGTFDDINSFGRIITEKELPKFEVKLSKHVFSIGENVFTDSSFGKVLNWDENNDYLTIESFVDFEVGDILIGESTKSQAYVREVFSLEQYYNVESSNIVNNGWNAITGFLNDSTQRLHDNDYYQYFSYSLKSEVPVDKWDIYVNNLNHTLGFKRFSDLTINSVSENIGIQTSHNNGTFTAVCDLDNVVDVDCIRDFDLVYENYFYVENNLISNEIVFNSTLLIDYSESIGNKVLIIDDISNDFNTNLSNTFVTSFNI